MRDSVLYFPYIQLPETPWLAQILLYWDTISSIVPTDFGRDPNRLTPYTRELLRAGLVEQLNPGAHLYRLRNFVRAFEDHIARLGPAVWRRADRFEQGHRTAVHMEKIEQVGEVLRYYRLADRTSWNWFDVETETAAEFMTYLATVLGQLPEVGAVPVTDELDHLRRLTDDGRSRLPLTDVLREELIREVLPLPRHLPPAADLRRFKDRHRKWLVPFRRRLEREVIDLAAIDDPDLRSRRRALFLDECEEAVAELGGGMLSAGWAPTLGSIGAVVATVPGAPWVVGLASATFDALRGGRRQPGTAQDLAYVAFTHRMFGDRPAAPRLLPEV